MSSPVLNAVPGIALIPNWKCGSFLLSAQMKNKVHLCFSLYQSAVIHDTSTYLYIELPFKHFSVSNKDLKMQIQILILQRTRYIENLNSRI